MSSGKGERSDGMELPDWWHQLVVQAVEARKHKETLAQLGAKAAAAVGREKAWDHAAVRRFLDKTTTTREMTLGLTAVLGVPPLVFYARSPAEAYELAAVARSYDAAPTTKVTKSTPDKAAKLQEADQVLAAFEEAAKDQTDRLDSQDERTNRRGRPRRAPRGRAASS